ncbi:PEP-CTERM sorting domain-containing protein [Piscinibacter koreensis]|uniref:PEP-CTERM sorting domain-containing protein n=1 Tax=Piscinibacter koreensis TaxID=2742824 RepID=A0A7Y6TYQ8_9BURK|nr:PEP-CTERM sorting domain-containing protein [Schlegelella koreensis]NUZ08375.1 PEP-CTERM sorting domain-containing protein [Schlegelella koreensis]
MKMNLPSLVAFVALTLGGSLDANAGFVDVNLAGWKALGAFDASDDSENTRLVIDLGQSATITGFEYSNLRLTTSGDSWFSEFVISVNNTGNTQWLDWRPSTTEAGGSLGPISGSFGGTTGQGGPYGAGGPFTLIDGRILVTTYLSYFIDPVGVTVQSGNLRVNFIPEPATYAMVAFGLVCLAGLAGVRRSQQSNS